MPTCRTGPIRFFFFCAVEPRGCSAENRGMNLASDPKSMSGGVLSPEANQAAALADAAGVLPVDLDAIIANWRKLEKTAVPAECAAVIKADAYGCGAEPVARALAAAGCKTFFVATLDEARAVRAAVPAAA